jgi:phosphoglucomutase
VAVRASGTEPKIKFYFFMRGAVGSEGELEKVKAESITALNALWDFTQADVEKRVG